MTDEEAMSSPGSPYLYVQVGTAKDKGTYAYCINIQFTQMTQLARNPAIKSKARMWQTGSTGLVAAENIRGVRRFVLDQVDQFIKAYLSVNPK